MEAASQPVLRSFALLGVAVFAIGGLLASQPPAAAGGRSSAQNLPPPVVSSAGGDISSTSLARGRQLYIAKCARCHKFHDPARYADSEWQTWMEKMSRKSKLKPEQERLLSSYLETFRNPAKPDHQ